MDELVENLSSSFQVTKEPNSIYAKHPRFDLYKHRTLREGDQTVRRENFLKLQKKRRCDFLDHVRCLVVGEWKEDDDAQDVDEIEEQMDVVEVKVRPPKRYKNQLMLSEWLVEVPDDFEDKWLMVVCPVGKRNLVVAAKGRTRCYSKSGYCIDTFASALPGGSYNNNSGYTVLDCIYRELDKTFFVLDIMCWNSHSVYESDTEFRFFWLQSKLMETPELSEKTENNFYKILRLQNHSCKKEGILSALENWDAKAVDGLLFYNKNTHYTFGATPLVTWLKVPMIGDILNIPPPGAFVENTTEPKMNES
ncbi:snurportin-1-like [Clavelina lepadiformis]|uniref:snurportin-1-like n=1 Tax=Clavelina lepadiformis TaxID=159417 RepID=UPI004040EC6D